MRVIRVDKVQTHQNRNIYRSEPLLQGFESQIEKQRVWMQL